jgi:hypothetical protein
VGSSPAPRGFGVEERSFSSPEEAIKAFYASLSAGDLYGALQTCAVNEYGDRFDFNAYTKWLQAITWMDGLSPSKTPFFGELNKVNQLRKLCNQIRFLCYSVLTPERDFERTLAMPSDDRVAAFVNALSQQALAGIKLAKIGKLPATSDSRYKERANASAAPFGANEATERTILLRVGKGYFMTGVTLYRYGSSWRISALTSPLQGTSGLGLAKETTVQEFDESLQ